MKIAICISGLPRSYKQGFEELKTHFLDKYECDIYIHSWYDITSTYETGHKFAPKVYYNFTEEDYQNIIDLYQPKSYNFQKPIPFDINEITGINLGYKLNNILSAALSAQSCFNLLEESKIDYDLIIRYRFDLQFTDYVSPKCIFLDDITKVDPNKISVFSFPKDSYILYYVYMDEDYSNWLEYHVTNPDLLSAEPLLKYHLTNNNIEINPVESGVSHWYTAGIIR